MKIAHHFAAARAAAQHCPELTRTGLGQEERAGLLVAWRRDLARLLGESLSPLLSGDRLTVSVSEAETMAGAAALSRIGPVAANCLLRCGASGESALLSFDLATAIALTDRSFGGDGKLPGDAPEQLPRSAALMVEEAAALIAGAITRASHGDASLPAGAPDRSGVIVRSESAARLKPFDPADAVKLFTITLANGGGCEWRAALAIAADRIDRLLPGTGAASAPRARSTSRAPADGLAAPFGDMPLPLHVVLAEFELSLSRLEQLAPGDLIPLAMGRQVPLMVGETLIAQGSVGTADDRMAIRLTRFPASPAQGSFR